MSADSSSRWSLHRSLQPGVDAVVRNWPPLVLIQLGAVALVFGYYRWGPLRDAASGAADLKLRYGIWFALAAGFCAGGIVPEISKAATGKLKRLSRDWLAESLFNGFVYGLVGLSVDLFYRLQTYNFGAGHDVRTLALKTLVDMGLFAPVFSIPSATLLFAWRNCGYRISRLLPAGIAAFYRDQVMPGLIPCWFFWAPVLLCTYAMPVNLQLAFSLIAEAAWSIVFVFIAKESHPPPP